MIKVLVLTSEKKDQASRWRRHLIVRALRVRKTKLLNPLPGRPPEKKEFFPPLLPQVFYQKTLKLLKKSDLVIADLTEVDFKTGFLVSQALAAQKPVLGLFWQSISWERIKDWPENDFLFTDCFNQENIRSVLRRFLNFLRQRQKQRGKLIVIDGTDGSGKATQTKLLFNFLKKKGLKTKYIDFPRYYSSFHGGTVGRYLKGEFGRLSEVNPYLASLAYALDRLTAKDEIEDWLRNGNIVIANRYTSSNMAHQASRVKEKEKFLDWLIEMEYKVHKLPKEDLLIFLHVPAQISQKLVARKDKRKYLGPKKSDIHEKNLHHLKKAEKMYLFLTKKFPHWQKINCLDDQNKLLPIQKIHQKIIKLLAKKKIISPAPVLMKIKSSP